MHLLKLHSDYITYIWLKSRRTSSPIWLLYRRIHIQSWLFYRPTTITGTNIIISVLDSIDVTLNDLRRFVPICGHCTSKTKLAGQTLYPTCQSPQSAARSDSVRFVIYLRTKRSISKSIISLLLIS